MALTTILSTQILHSLFVDNSISALRDSELIKLDAIVYEKNFIYA
jgi:hypothetical protein